MSADPVRPPAGSGDDSEFVPRGAIAFLGVMVVLYAAVWFLFYWILLGRS